MNEESIIKELDFLTGTISNRVRTISGGLIFFCLLQISDPEKTFFTAASLFITSIVSILALFSDYVQYLLGYKLTHQLLKKIDADKPEAEIHYDSKSFLYRGRQAMFYSKQILTLLAIIYFAIQIIVKI